jgi:hypothetical protein
MQADWGQKLWLPTEEYFRDWEETFEGYIAAYEGRAALLKSEEYLREYVKTPEQQKAVKKEIAWLHRRVAKMRSENSADGGR